MLSPEGKKLSDYETSCAVIIASKPFLLRQDVPPSVEASAELTKKIREEWKRLFSSTPS
jgi:hypothetical protein